jgi:hypothetical protein
MQVRQILVLAAALLAGPACDNPAAPAARLAVQLHGPVTVSSGIAPEEGVECGLQLTATARGAGHARWTRAHFQWRDIATGAVLGSGGWDAAGVHHFWASEGIAAGEVLTSSAGAIGGPHAFRLHVVFEFTLDDSPELHTTSHTFTCGS